MSHPWTTAWLTFSLLAAGVTGSMATSAPAPPPTTAPQPVVEEKIVVRVGDSVVVARKAQPISKEETNLGSVTKVVQGTGPGAVNLLVYVPPADNREAEAVVKYTVEGRDVTVPISVKAAAPTLTDADLYSKSFKALFALFILAVLVENGLALIFRWRPFLDYFDSRTVNAVVAFAFSLVLVSLFQLDITTSLINTYVGTAHPVNWPGTLLTAAIIAGGSAGVNRIFQALGFRAVSAQQQPPPPRLEETEAWIAVTLVRSKAVGAVSVLIGQPGQLAVAGTISGVTPGRSWWRYVVRDRGRFPMTGGYSVTPGQTYEVVLHGLDRNGDPVVSNRWGPYAVARRAIIDIELTA
jgi:hypothetical protein